MLNLNLKNPQYELERLYNISLKGKSRKLSNNQFLKANIRKIIKEVSEYFVDNPNNFIILCNLLDLNGDGINLRLIDYYCHKHNIYPEVEVISIDKINEAFDNTVAGKVRYRYVIDMSSL